MYAFISHMVQIIHLLFMTKKKSNLNFISHMVQIIQNKEEAEEWIEKSLYPTWFR